MKTLFLFLFILLGQTILFGQAPRKFYLRFGGNGYDVGYDVKQTLDNGYIITGSTSSYGQGNTDMYLVKLDSMGNKKFETTFGNYNNDIGKSVIQLADSSFVMVGYTNSTGFGGYDIFLVKADKNGNLLWQKTIGGSDWDFAYSLQQTLDGGFIIGGTTYSFGHGNADGYLVKTDINGNVNWTKTFGGANDDEFKSVIQTADGGYAMTGYTKSYNDIDSGDVWVYKLDALGDSTWCIFYGGGKEDFANSITQLQNLDLIIAGGTRSFSSGGNLETVFSVFNLLTGNLTHTYVDLSSVDEYYNDIEQGINGFIVGCGSTHSILYSFDGVVDIYTSGYNYFNAYSAGAILPDELFAVNKTKDKGYVLLGKTNNFGATLDDVYFIKTDSLGNYGNYINTGYKDEIINNNVSLSIYPNPTSDIVNIGFSDKSNTINLKLKVVDLAGKEIEYYIINKYNNLIKISNLESGFYILQIYDANMLIKSAKISVIK